MLITLPQLKRLTLSLAAILAAVVSSFFLAFPSHAAEVVMKTNADGGSFANATGGAGSSGLLIVGGLGWDESNTFGITKLDIKLKATGGACSMGTVYLFQTVSAANENPHTVVVASIETTTSIAASSTTETFTFHPLFNAADTVGFGFNAGGCTGLQAEVKNAGSVWGAGSGTTADNEGIGFNANASQIPVATIYADNDIGSVFPFGGGGGGSWGGTGTGGFGDWDTFFDDAVAAQPSCDFWGFDAGEGLDCLWLWVRYAFVPPEEVEYNYLQGPWTTLATRWPINYLSEAWVAAESGLFQDDACPIPDITAVEYGTTGVESPEVVPCDWFDDMSTIVAGSAALETVIILGLWVSFVLYGISLIKRFFET